MKRLFPATLALLLPSMAFVTDNSQDAVFDKNGSTIVSTSGACIRTKWDAPNDKCIPKVADVQAPAPEPAPAPAPVPTPKGPDIALEQRTLYFDFDKEALTAEAMLKLDSLVQIITKDTKITKAIVVGHADIIGDSSYNIDLSKRRARNAQYYLSTRVRVPVHTLTVRGVGATESVTDCAESLHFKERVSCLSDDRRVVIELTYEK